MSVLRMWGIYNVIADGQEKREKDSGEVRCLLLD